MEIRTIFEPSGNLEEGPREKKYMVHKVDAMSDTLFQLSYRYKVSMKEIQRVNGFSGVDIFFMKEMLIPYRG